MSRETAHHSRADGHEHVQKGQVSQYYRRERDGIVNGRQSSNDISS